MAAHRTLRDHPLHLHAMMGLAASLVAGRVDARVVGETKTDGDAPIAMDQIIEQALIDYVRAHALGEVYSEERGWAGLADSTEYVVVADPLDGSTNYAQLARNPLFPLPHGILLAILRRPQAGPPLMRNVVAAGLREFTTGQFWVYDGDVTVDATGMPVNLGERWRPGKDTPASINLYHGDDYRTLAPLAGNVVFARNTGSCAANVAAVLAGVNAAFVDLHTKAEEAFAVAALLRGIKGARLCDPQGAGVDDMPFEPGRYYPLIGGASNIVTAMVQALAA